MQSQFFWKSHDNLADSLVITAFGDESEPSGNSAVVFCDHVLHSALGFSHHGSFHCPLSYIVFVLS